MAVYFIDPSAAVNGSGSFASPFNSYASVPALAAGDKVLQKAGTTFNGHVSAAQSGAQGNPIIYGVYDATGAEVEKSLGAARIAGIGSAADNFSTQAQSWITVRCLEFTNVTAGRAGVTLGSSASAQGCRASYCRVSNQPLSSAGFNVRTNPGVYPNAVEYSEASFNAYGILFQGGSAGGALEFVGNTCSYNAEAGIRIAISTAGAIVGTIRDNVCRFNGVAQGVTGKGVGIDNVSDAYDLLVQKNDCSDNYSIGIRLATFGGAINQTRAYGNTCDRNGEFGIQVSRGAGFRIRGNKCRWNGADRGNRYGRGIEIYSSNGGFPAGPGVIQANDCSYNYNFGGTLNNGTEGCGIGLDDNHRGLMVVGNICIGNEGNGIQFNPNGASGTNIVVGNLLVDNYCAPSTRVTAGWPEHSRAQIALFTSEANAKLYNNTCVLTATTTCLYGISEGPAAAGAGVEASNNLLIGHAVGMKVRTGITRLSNAFWRCAKNVESNADMTTLADGTGALVIDPQVDPATYRPLDTSPLRGAGVFVGWMLDASSKRFRNPPCIGAFEYVKRRATPSNDSDPWSVL